MPASPSITSAAALRPALPSFPGATAPRTTGANAAQRDATLIDAMVQHVNTPLSETVAPGFAPANPSGNLLQRHLEYFDRNRDGRIGLGENYEGWRKVGYARIGAGAFAVGSAVAFRSFPALLTLSISIDAAMGKRRPNNPSRVLDSKGQLNEPRFREFLGAFLKHARETWPAGDGAMKRADFLAFLDTEAVKGLSKKQFKTMLVVLDNCGAGSTVTAMDLAALYSSALLYNADAVISAKR